MSRRRSKSDADKARRLFESARREHGEDDPRTIKSLVDLGRAYRGEGEPDAARECLEHAIALLKRHSGEDDFETLKVQTLLAFVHSDRGDLKLAEEIQWRVLAIVDERFGSESKQSIAAAINLANTLRDLQRYQDELPLRRRVVDLQSQTFGLTAMETLRSLADLAMVQHNVGEFEVSLELNRYLLETTPKDELDHRTAISFQFNMATDLLRLKRWNEASTVFNHAWEEATQYLDPEDSLRRQAASQKTIFQSLDQIPE